MNKKVFVIAEIGHNFHGNIRFAKKMIDEAKKCGVDAVKTQLYDITKLGLRPQESDVYPELEMGQINFEEFQYLKDYADSIGIELFASAFDQERVEWCERVGVKRHKLASRSVMDKEIIKAMEKTGKPIIASLGMVETKDAPVIQNGKYLYCVADYPATITEEMFPKKFGYPNYYEGFSDHTIGIEWAKEAIRRGATIIEKHFTLDKRLPGCDQSCSADPKEMKELIEFIKNWETNSI